MPMKKKKDEEAAEPLVGSNNEGQHAAAPKTEEKEGSPPISPQAATRHPLMQTVRIQSMILSGMYGMISVIKNVSVAICLQLLSSLARTMVQV